MRMNNITADLRKTSLGTADFEGVKLKMYTLCASNETAPVNTKISRH